MSTWKGRLVREDIGPGRWIVQTKGGDRIELSGRVPEELDGKTVVVEGSRAEGMMGIGMFDDLGPIRISSIRPL